MRTTLWMVLLIAWMAPLTGLAQELDGPKNAPAFERTGKVWFHWGYNRAAYKNSDIHFKGKGFDFTLHDAKAHDMPETFDPKIYFHPFKLTIPQFNFRVGYWLNEHFSISAGWDHMKYKLYINQQLDLSGTIDASVSEQYAGTYDHFRGYNMNFDFLRYEHSDGFNFVRIGGEYSTPVWTSKKQTVQASLTGGLYAGLMFPWTDTWFFGEYHRNWIHLAGYGLSTTAGWRIDFLKHFFVEARAQYGWTHLSNILIEDGADSRANQKIVFMERAFVAGATFRLWK